jgi:Spy/CpxP family protein refolding chaperone
MDYFSKNKISLWIIAILVLMNLFTLSTIWFKDIRLPFAPPPETGHRREGLRILEKELNLSVEQITLFKEIRKQHFDKRKRLQEEVHTLRGELMDELFKPEPDTVAIKMLAVQIGAKETEKEQCMFEHFMELKSACTPEQQGKFESLMKKVLPKSQRMPRPGARWHDEDRRRDERHDRPDPFF